MVVGLTPMLVDGVISVKRDHFDEGRHSVDGGDVQNVANLLNAQGNNNKTRAHMQ